MKSVRVFSNSAGDISASTLLIVAKEIGQTFGQEVQPKNKRTTEPRRSWSDKGPSGEFKVKSPPVISFAVDSEFSWATEVKTNSNEKNKLTKTKKNFVRLKNNFFQYFMHVILQFYGNIRHVFGFKKAGECGGFQKRDMNQVFTNQLIDNKLHRHKNPNQ